MFSLQRMAAILDIRVKMMLKCKSDVRIGILVVDLVASYFFKMALAAILDILVKMMF